MTDIKITDVPRLTGDDAESQTAELTAHLQAFADEVAAAGFVDREDEPATPAKQRAAVVGRAIIEHATHCGGRIPLHLIMALVAEQVQMATDELAEPPRDEEAWG
jgi:hypothetical protein